MKKARGKKSDLGKPDIQVSIKQYVQATGVYSDVWLLANVSEATFYAFLNEHKDFREELETIKATSDPVLSVEMRKKAVVAFEEVLTHGNRKKLFDVDAETGEERLVKIIETGVPKWAIERVLFPDRPIENALNMVIASQIAAITNDTELTDEHKRAFYVFLDRFRRAELIQIVLRGGVVREQLSES